MGLIGCSNIPIPALELSVQPLKLRTGILISVAGLGTVLGWFACARFLGWPWWPAVIPVAAAAGWALCRGGVRRTAGAPSAIATEEDLQAEALKQATAHWLAAKRVLIVDNHAETAAMLKATLEVAGYECRVLKTPLRVMEIVRAFHPSLVTTNIMMPGLDGLGLIQLLKTEWKEPLAVVVVSSCSVKFFINRAFALGVDDYIFSPFEPEDLRARIKWAMDKNENRLENGM